MYALSQAVLMALAGLVANSVLLVAPVHAAAATVAVFCSDGTFFSYAAPDIVDALCKTKNATVVATIPTPTKAEVASKGRKFILCKNGTVTETTDGSPTDPFCAKPGAGGVVNSNIAAPIPDDLTNQPPSTAGWYLIFCNDYTGGVSLTPDGRALCYGHGGLMTSETAGTVPGPNDMLALCKDGTTVKTTTDGLTGACSSGLLIALFSQTGEVTQSTNPKCSASVVTPGLDATAICSARGGPIFGLINFAINWLIRILGGVAVLALIVSGIQYITSQGNPDAIKKAKSRITNVIIGLLLLSIMFVVLKFIGIG